MTGLIVDRVDVTVHDVHLPEQDNEESNEAAYNANQALAQ